MVTVRGIKTSGDDLLQLSAIPGVESHPELNEDNAKRIEDVDHTYSIVDVFGRVWAILGILEYSPGKYESWMMIDPGAGKLMLQILRMAKKYLNDHFYDKDIESYIGENFRQAQRLNVMLGFKLQAPDKAQKREGQIYAQYILSKKDRT